MARRTFRLLKEAPDLAKGALVQEECDDGTQDFISITKPKYCDSIHYTREEIFKQPDWFEEVFEVYPRYLTKAEIKKFKAKKK